MTNADPRAWTAATVDAPVTWYCPLSQESHAALGAALQTLRREPRPLTEVRASDFALGAVQRDLASALEVLEQGRGFVVLQGPDPTVLSDDDAKAAYWFVGQLLGEPFAQNVQGTVLYDVRDTGQSVEYGARFSVTNAESSYHTDNSFGDTVLDYVGLQCLKIARSGGLNQNVSGYAIVDVLRREYPEALAVLEQPFYVDRRGGVLPGQSPTAFFPVIAWENGELLLRYLRYWIGTGHEKAGVPLTEAQVAALDTLDEVAARLDLRIELALKPGDMFFINNRWILHNRTAFDDHPEPEKKRHLVRLWLQRRG